MALGLAFTIQKMSNARTRTITWEDPRALAKPAIGLSGIEYLQKIKGLVSSR